MEERCKHKIIPRYVIEQETEEPSKKHLRCPPSSKSIHQRISWSTRIIKDPPSKPSLLHVLELCKLLLPIGFSEPYHLQFSRIPQFSPIASVNNWLLPMLPSSTKTSLDTQIGCGKCLGYQPLKDLEMERQEQRKTIRKYVDDYGYNNL